MKVKIFAYFIILLLFILGPFYWLPGISPSHLTAFKASLLSLSMALILIDLFKDPKIISSSTLSIMFFGLFCLVFSSVYILIIYPTDSGRYFLAQVIISSFFLLIGVKYGKDFFESLLSTNKRYKILIFVTLITVAILLGISFLLSPSFLQNPFIQNTYANQLSNTGFGGGRTGWAVGFTFLSCFLLALIKSENKINNLISLITYLILCTIIVAIPGGRSGIIFFLAFSFLVIRLATQPFKKYRYLAYIYVSSIIVIFLYTLLDYSESRFIDTLLNSRNLNDLSSSRLDGYIVALQLLSDNPFGYGFNSINLEDYNIYYKTVHNVWLALALQLGVIPVALFLLTYLITLIHLVKRANMDDYVTVGLVALVFSGFYYSFFEPVSFLGNMQQTLIYWFSLGALIRINFKR